MNRMCLPRLYQILALLALLLIQIPLHADQESTSHQDRKRAAAALEQDTKNDPNNPELWLHLGFAYRKLDNLTGAENAFEKTRTLDPHNRDALFMLGLIYEKQHDPRAKQTWEDYLGAASTHQDKETARKHLHQLQ